MKEFKQMMVRLRAYQDQADASIFEAMNSIHTAGCGHLVDSHIRQVAEGLVKDQETAMLGFFLIVGLNKANEVWTNRRASEMET